MKKVFIAFEVEDGELTPHDHPVFTGEAAYDLGEEQEVQVDPELDVREFTGVGEAQAALADYFRTCPKEDQVRMTPFVLLEMYSGEPFISAAPKAKTKTPVKAVKAPKKKNEE